MSEGCITMQQAAHTAVIPLCVGGSTINFSWGHTVGELSQEPATFCLEGSDERCQFTAHHMLCHAVPQHTTCHATVCS